MKLTGIGGVVEKVPTWNPRSSSDKTFTYLDLSSVDNKTKVIVSPTVVPTAEAPSRARQIVAAGDVLVSTVRPNLNAVALVPDALDGATASTGFCVLRSNKRMLDSNYLFHWVRSTFFVSEMTRLATGANYPAVSDAIIKDSQMPIPSIREQLRIASILDAADALIAKRRQTLEKLDALTQSIFIDMFGNPISNPKKWPVQKFEHQIENVRYGTGSPPPYLDEGGIAFIRATDIKGGRIRKKGMKRISEADALALSKCQLKTDDLIIVRSGVNTGDCAVVPPDLNGACAAYDMIVSLDPCNAHFYCYLFNSPEGRLILEPLSRRAAQPHLNAEQIRGLEIIVPAVEERERFVKRLERITLLRSTIEAETERMSQLFCSLQHQAFRGDL